MYYLCALSKISCIYLCGSVSGVLILLHWSMHLVFHLCRTIFITVAVQEILNSGSISPAALFFCFFFPFIIELPILVYFLIAYPHHMTIEAVCWYPWNKLLIFWLGLHWICRSTWKNWHIDNIEKELNFCPECKRKNSIIRWYWNRNMKNLKAGFKN